MITTRYTNFENFDYNNKKRNDFSCRRFTLDEKKNWTTDESSDEQSQYDKDRFIELAQAALEEAKMEEEQKGVLQELIEALLVRTGAPMMADVILEQFRSQDVIERLAEDHFDEQQKRRSSSQLFLSNQSELYSPHVLKEPITTSTTTTTITTTTVQHNNSHDYSSIDTMLLISEYLWRIFRLLLLSSLVCLVYHFMCAEHISFIKL